MYFVISLVLYLLFLGFGQCIQIFSLWNWHWLWFVVYLLVHLYINYKIKEHRAIIDALGSFFLILLMSLVYFDFSILTYLFMMYFICLEAFSYTYEYQHKH